MAIRVTVISHSHKMLYRWEAAVSNFNEYYFPTESYKNYISHLTPRIQGYEFSDSTEQRARKSPDMKLSYYSPIFQNVLHCTSSLHARLTRRSTPVCVGR
jgi:hypothetical protein